MEAHRPGCPALNIQRYKNNSHRIGNEHLNVSVLAEATHITRGDKTPA